jgi:sulfide dehydrogenase cytochrome subunit
LLASACLATASLALAGGAPPASAQQQAGSSRLATAALAAACNACHGARGDSIAGIPPLAGRSQEDLTSALLDFKYGRRSSSVMHRHARGYEDDELRAIAAEYARLTPVREGKTP